MGIDLAFVGSARGQMVTSTEYRDQNGFIVTNT